MEFQEIHLNYTPLKPELLMRHHEETHPEEIYYKKKIKQVMLIAGIIIIVVSIGIVAYLYKGSIQTAFVSAKQRMPSPAPQTTATPAPTKKIFYQSFSSALKGYSFDYPDNWTLTEKEGFLLSTHVMPPGKEFEIVISEGQIPYTLGKSSTKRIQKTITVDSETFTIEEVTVDNAQKIIDFPLKHPDKDLHVLVRTMTGDVSTNTTNIAAFNKNEELIKTIISSIKYVNTSNSRAPEGWSEFNEYGFRLYYPSTLAISKQTDGEVIWGDSKMILRSSSTEYKKIVSGSAVLIDTNTNKNIIAGADITTKNVTMGDVNGQQVSFTCGTDCSYSVLHFSSFDTYYELLFDTRAKEALKQFDDIVAAIRFQ